MRTALYIITALTFFVCSLPSVAAEKGGADIIESELHLPDQEQYKDIADLRWTLFHSHPGAQMTIVVHYPQGLGMEADTILGDMARDQFDEAYDPFEEYMTVQSAEERKRISSALGSGTALPEKEESSHWYSAVYYQIFRPSNTRYVSVLFKKEEYTGGAHGNRSYTAITFDLGNGKQLDLHDLFEDEAKARSILVPRIADAVQSQKAQDAEPVNRTPEAIDLSMKRLILTPEGARIVYAPYEMGSYAEGEFTVVLPKEELLQAGAVPQLWQNTSEGNGL